MISVRTLVLAAVVAAMMVLAVGGAAFGQTHAPWPSDWNNWSDPALWVTVGNPGNTGEWSGRNHGGYGEDRICGPVGYTFNMGKFEVTAGQYTAFLNAVAKTDTYGLYSPQMADPMKPGACNIQRSNSSGSYTYSVASDWANRPVNFVSWGDAARFANWLTNGQPTGPQGFTTTEGGSYYLNGATTHDALLAVARIADGARTPGKKYYFIPTEDEWYKAAYHKNDGATGNYFDYATGSNSKPSELLINPDPGNNATYQPYDITIGSPYFRTEVGDHENSESPYGTFDQSGDVAEWNEAIVEVMEVYLHVYRGMRGGYFGTMFAYELNAADRGCNYPTFEFNFAGFRVSEVPEPATLSLLVLGGLALVARRKKN